MKHYLYFLTFCLCIFPITRPIESNAANYDRIVNVQFFIIRCACLDHEVDPEPEGRRTMGRQISGTIGETSGITLPTAVVDDIISYEIFGSGDLIATYDNEEDFLHHFYMLEGEYEIHLHSTEWLLLGYVHLQWD